MKTIISQTSLNTKSPINPALLLGLISISLALVGCTTTSTSSKNTGTTLLMKYHNLSNFKYKAGDISGIRNIGLRDTALSLGARAGLAWRAEQINQSVMHHERQLDLVYNFNGMLLDDNVLPPVLIEGRQTLDQFSDNVIRVADRAYSIQSQARFVTLAPTWRDYLKLNYGPPELPDTSLLPRNETEKKIWDRYLDEGWQAGITQADVIFAESLGRLKRDYNGMILYRKLLAQNMVSRPFVAQANLGVTGGEDQMAINDRVMTISALPEFNTASQEWESQITPEETQPTPERK